MPDERVYDQNSQAIGRGVTGHFFPKSAIPSKIISPLQNPTIVGESAIAINKPNNIFLFTLINILIIFFGTPFVSVNSKIVNIDVQIV